MPVSFDSRRLRHQRAMDARLTADHRQLARQIAGLVVRAAAARDAKGEPIIPATRASRDALKAAVWEQVLKPYYIGATSDALRGPTPLSPYAALLVDGITQATRIQAERQTSIVKRLCKDDVVLAWLTGPRSVLAAREMAPMGYGGRITELNTIRLGDDPIVTRTVNAMGLPTPPSQIVRPRGTYDAFHRWVDPNGYRLSDRIWTTSINVRSRIDALMEYHIANGTSAIEIANLLEPFLTPGGKKSRTLKPYPPPYGTEGSYAARRLARTEITAAAGRATVNASAANPFVQSIQWRLSGSHRDLDQCNVYASGGPNGDGIYPIDQVPAYPSHPHELCSLLPVPTGTTADLVSTLRADIQAARGNLIDAASGGNAARARQLQGLLNPAWLTRSILSGSLEDALMALIGVTA
jgi:hypothetical protein